MRELNELEIDSVDGSGIIYDAAYAAGAAAGGWFNAAMEAIYNGPFRQQYRAA